MGEEILSNSEMPWLEQPGKSSWLYIMLCSVDILLSVEYYK